MYICCKCYERFTLYHEDEQRRTCTCPFCGSEFFDDYYDEDWEDDEDGYDDDEEEDDDVVVG